MTTPMTAVKAPERKEPFKSGVWAFGPFKSGVWSLGHSSQGFRGLGPYKSGFWAIQLRVLGHSSQGFWGFGPFKSGFWVIQSGFGVLGFGWLVVTCLASYIAAKNQACDNVRFLWG